MQPRININISVLFLLLSYLISSSAFAKKPLELIEDYKSPVPKLVEFNLNASDIAKLVEDKQMILTHPPTTISAPVKKGLKEFKDVIFVTSAMTINKPATEVRNIVLDYPKYKDFVPHTERSEVLKSKNGISLIETLVRIDTPIFDIKETIKLQYTLEDDGDITILMRKGVVDASLSRWEFIEISPKKTLAVYTSWTDLGSANFIVKTILKSDPDLKRAAPIALGAVVIEEFKKRAEGEPPLPKLEDMPTKATQPKFAQGKTVPIDTLTKLSKIGTLLFVHKAQWINHPKEGKMEFIYVTAGKVLEAPKEYVISKSTRFDRYKEFFHHVRNNKLISESGNLRDDPFDVKWRLKVGLGIMKIRIKYDLHYEWLDRSTLAFNRTKGDIGHVNGVWEFIEIDSSSTLMMITGVSKVGKEGSLILRTSNSIPNLEMIGTIIAQALIIEKQEPWIEKQFNPYR